MNKIPTSKQIDKAIRKRTWDFGNNILYGLCRNNFQHKEGDKILTKVLFIGRIYAAAIERRKHKKDIKNDDFYLHTVIPTFKYSRLDADLQKLKKIKRLNSQNIQSILETHQYLTSDIRKITEHDNRSFCSKYLHFHLPNLFFIYDSRVEAALRLFTSKVSGDLTEIIQSVKVDKRYAIFFCKCFEFKQKIESHYNTNLTNREFDKILIEFSKKDYRREYDHRKIQSQ